MKKAKSWLCKQAPLGVKGVGYFDWVKLDQIYSAVMEEWPLMRHNAILVGAALCERSVFNEGGLGFASSQLIKGRGWKHEDFVDGYHIFKYIFCLDIHHSLAV